MTEELTQMLEACDINDKLHHNKSKILSYLSILEKIYDNQIYDKSDQERIYRLNKAINSIKNYSNIKVSPFKLKESPPNKEQKSPEINKINKEKENENNEIDDLLCFIEKELKLSGIDTNDVNDSFLSTNVKSENSESKSDINNTDKNSGIISDNKSDIIISNTNQKNQKRLSKLFLKLEMKLKTFLQENSQNSSTIKLISDKDKESIDKKSEDENKSKQTKKRPSKLPDLANSFFSNKKKVEALLNRAKKQRRKSMIEFNAKFLNKEKKKEEYIENSLDKNAKNKKIVPCTAQINRPKRKKKQKKDENKRVSNFFDMIIEKDEDNENDDMNPFKVINEKINEEDSKVHEDNMINENPIFFDNNDTSIKITSTINKNKIENDLPNKEKEPKQSILNKSKDEKDKIVSDNENNNSECKIVFNINSDNNKDIFFPSPDRYSSSSQYDDEDDYSDDDDSSSYDSSEEASDNLNSSNDSKEDKKSKENNDKKKSVICLSKGKGVKRNSNFNNFFRNSIFSPWKDVVESREKQDNLIEEFGKSDL